MSECNETVYISGPMTGLPSFNYPAFMAAEALWAERGYEVINPARLFGGDVSLPRAIYMRGDLLAILTRATMLATLPGWEESAGALLEVAVARAIGLRVVSA